MELSQRKIQRIKNLKNLNLLNERIKSRIEQSRDFVEMEKYYQLIRNRESQVKKALNWAIKRNLILKYEFNLTLLNLDNRNIVTKFLAPIYEDKKKLKEEKLKEENVIKSLQHFQSFHSECILRLQEDLTEHQFIALKNCKNLKDLQDFLNSLNPVILIKKKLMKSIHGLDHLTRSSIYKTIYTGLKN